MLDSQILIVLNKMSLKNVSNADHSINLKKECALQLEKIHSVKRELVNAVQENVSNVNKAISLTTMESVL